MEFQTISVSIWKKLKLQKNNNFRTTKHNLENFKLRLRNCKLKEHNWDTDWDSTTLCIRTRDNDTRTWHNNNWTFLTCTQWISRRVNSNFHKSIRVKSKWREKFSSWEPKLKFFKTKLPCQSWAIVMSITTTRWAMTSWRRSKNKLSHIWNHLYRISRKCLNPT